MRGGTCKCLIRKRLRCRGALSGRTNSAESSATRQAVRSRLAAVIAAGRICPTRRRSLSRLALRAATLRDRHNGSQASAPERRANKDGDAHHAPARRNDTTPRADAGLVAAAVIAASPWAAAQDYPSHPVRLMVPFAAGGPGAGSIIGTDVVAKSAPDGYTLLLMSNTQTVTNRCWRPSRISSSATLRRSRLSMRRSWCWSRAARCRSTTSANGSSSRRRSRGRCRMHRRARARHIT